MKTEVPLQWKPFNIRLRNDMSSKIDELISDRPWFSKTVWILEAITEKLKSNERLKRDSTYLRNNMSWIRLQDQSPNIDEIVVAWMLKREEPCCVRYTKDEHGPLWVELVESDFWDDREDIITHWMPLPPLPFM